VPSERTLNATEVDFRCRQSGLLECDLKTEVDFVPRGADFEMQIENRS
jgi:hypothetical protein